MGWHRVTDEERAVRKGCEPGSEVAVLTNTAGKEDGNAGRRVRRKGNPIIVTVRMRRLESAREMTHDARKTPATHTAQNLRSIAIAQRDPVDIEILKAGILRIHGDPEIVEQA